MNPSIKKKNCIIKCNLHELHCSYIILTKQNILTFDIMYLKSSVHVWLATKYQNMIYTYGKCFPNSKFQIQNKLG